MISQLRYQSSHFAWPIEGKTPLGSVKRTFAQSVQNALERLLYRHTDKIAGNICFEKSARRNQHEQKPLTHPMDK
jgi:hypothetical protein